MLRAQRSRKPVSSLILCGRAQSFTSCKSMLRNSVKGPSNFAASLMMIAPAWLDLMKMNLTAGQTKASGMHAGKNHKNCCGSITTKQQWILWAVHVVPQKAHVTTVHYICKISTWMVAWCHLVQKSSASKASITKRAHVYNSEIISGLLHGILQHNGVDSLNPLRIHAA